MDELAAVERRADRSDAPIHHVRRRDHVHAGSRTSERLLFEDHDRLVVQNVAAAVDHAILAVSGIGIERDVGDDAEFGKALLQCRHRSWDEPLGIGCLAPVSGLHLAWNQGKHCHRRHTELHAEFRVRQQAIDRVAPNPRHRGHRLGPVPALDHEHGIDEVVRRQPVLAPQPARELVPPHPPHAPPRKAAVVPHELTSWIVLTLSWADRELGAIISVSCCRRC